MKFYFILFLICIGAILEARGQTTAEKIRLARRDFVAKRLNLTADQQPKFVDLYDNYLKEKHKINKQVRQLRTETVSLTATDEQINAAIEKRIELKQKELDLEKNYLAKYKAFLSPRQIVEIYKADFLFIKQLQNKLLQEED